MEMSLILRCDPGLNPGEPRRMASRAAIAQPDTGTAAVLRDELNPGGFKGGLDRRQRAEVDVLPGLKPADGRNRNLRLIGEIANAPTNRRAGHLALYWRHSFSLIGALLR